MISLDAKLLTAREYELAGALVAMTIYNGGNGIRMAKIVVDTMFDLPIDVEDLQIDLIADYALSEKLNQVCIFPYFTPWTQSRSLLCSNLAQIGSGCFLAVAALKRRKLVIF